MIHRYRFAALAAGSAIIALQTAPAAAEGTSAGTTITNTATIDFRVGGVDQTEVVASDTFDVDRKINLIVTRVSDPAVSVSPGQVAAVIAFDVTNLSNDTIDMSLGVIQSNLDDFDADNVVIYLDDGNGVFDGGDTATTLIDELPEDQTVRVFVVSDIALSVTNGQDADLLLSASAHAGSTPGVLGAVLVTDAGPDTAGIDTVLADGAGPDDAIYDGTYNGEGSYTVFAASLTVAKTSRVLSDPVNATLEPKAIPGAVIEYCIAVGNGAGAATATNIVITDVVPAELTFDQTFWIRVNGTVNGSGECAADGTAGGSFVDGTDTVTAPLSDIAASETLTAYFRATIN